MLRYLHLLICLLICIEWGFCYEFSVYEQDSGKSCGLERRNRLMARKHKVPSRKSRRIEYEDDKDPVASIDIANFIQQPDAEYDTNYKDLFVDKNHDERNEYENHAPSFHQHVEDETGYNDNMNYMSIDDHYPEKLKDFDELAKIDDTLKDESSSVMPAKKKRNKAKFPFFSHKKNSKQKKSKKRKRVRKYPEFADISTMLPNLKEADFYKNQYANTKIGKRSNEDRFCPVCKRKITNPFQKKLKKEKEKRVIHNSRQYYQEKGNIPKMNRRKENSFDSVNVAKDITYEGKLYKDRLIDDKRIKRENMKCRRELPFNKDMRIIDMNKMTIQLQPKRERKRTKDMRGRRDPNDDRERQLKELEEVQRKVDSVEVSLPQYAKNHNNDKRP